MGLLIGPLKIPVAQFSEPRGYTTRISQIVNMLNNSGANLAAGSTDPQDDDYKENFSRTVFYSCAENLWRGQNWGVRTGTALNDLSAGRDRALMVQLDRWGVGGQAGWHRAADVAFYAVQEGDWTGDRVATANDIDLHARSTDPKFAFSRLHEYKIGTQDNTNEDFYGFRTTMSRPASLWAKALIYEERSGQPRRIDPFQGPDLCIDWAIRMMSSHLYRWRTEQTDMLEAGAKSDDYANFMTCMTIDAIRVVTEWFEENSGDTRDLYFPSTVFDGTVASNSYITNPYSDWDDQLSDFLQWQANALEPGWVVDTRVFPQTDTLYPRISIDHTPPDSGFPKPSNQVRTLGDPMIFNEAGAEGDYAVCLYRSSIGYKAQNIQMMNATNFWWFATRLDGVDDTLRDKMIEWGDKIFYGAVVNNLGGLDQKASNQTLYLLFEGLEYRNSITGRND